MNQKLQNALQTIGAVGTAIKPWVSIAGQAIAIYATLTGHAHAPVPWLIQVSTELTSFLTKR